MQRGLINEISSPTPRTALAPASSTHLQAVIEDAVTALEVGMNHFPPGLMAPHGVSLL